MQKNDTFLLETCFSSECSFEGNQKSGKKLNKILVTAPWNFLLFMSSKKLTTKLPEFFYV